MLNSSRSLISEMIAEDDDCSAVVYAAFNIIESLTTGLFVFMLLHSGMVDDIWPLKMLMAFLPMICAVCSYLMSYW